MIRRGLVAIGSLAMLTGCGSTFVDESIAPPGSDVTATTLPAVDTDRPVPDLLAEIEDLMVGLDQRIVDEDGQVETLARIDAVWAVAEPKIRADDPAAVFNFGQAIELARTGVERRRPADASKGGKILADVVDAYLGR